MIARTSQTSSFALALALSIGTALPAIAGGWAHTNGGLKGSYGHEAIPVPAPVPIPDYQPEWYLRGDISYNFSSSGDLSSRFEPRDIDPLRDEVALTGLDLDVTDLNNLEGQGVFGFGFGRYLTEQIRVDFTGEFRVHQTVVENPQRDLATVRDTATAGQNFELVDAAGNGTGVFVTETFSDHQVQVDRNEQTELGSYMLMANLYYDLGTRHGITPYVGAGLGLVIHSINRDFSEDATCFDQQRFYTDGAGNEASQATGSCGLAGGDQSRNGGTDTTGVGLGLAVMAGLGYEIRDGLHWDIGYRYVYQDGSVAVTTPTFNGASVIEIEGRHDHELRTGIRFDIQ